MRATSPNPVAKQQSTVRANNHAAVYQPVSQLRAGGTPSAETKCQRKKSATGPKYATLTTRSDAPAGFTQTLRASGAKPTAVAKSAAGSGAKGGRGEGGAAAGSPSRALPAADSASSVGAAARDTASA